MTQEIAGGLGSAQLVVVTLCTVLMIGLGFIPQPTRASRLWAMGFLLALVATYATVVSDAFGVEALRRASIGVLFAAPVLTWAGMRAWRGAASYAWIAIPVGAIAAGTLSLPLDDGAFPLIFRVIFLGVAVFPALTLQELRRIPEHRERMLLPLGLCSLIFALLAVTSMVAGLLPIELGDPLRITRAVNSLGMIVYLICTLVSLLWLSQGTPTGSVRTLSGWARFQSVATERLERACDTEERAWALLVMRLDDTRDLKDAAGDLGFAAITTRYEGLIRQTFPADVDIGRQSSGTIVALIPRTTPIVREYIRALLRDLSTTHGENELQMSASVGWVSVDTSGYDFFVLERTARAAADQAAAEGGDRWHRVR